MRHAALAHADRRSGTCRAADKDGVTTMSSELGNQASTGAGNLRERVEAALRLVFDPEIPVNIYDLGLIYDVAISDSGAVDIKMTLTAPNCPAAGALPDEVGDKGQAAARATQGHVQLIWGPPSSKSRMAG